MLIAANEPLVIDYSILTIDMLEQVPVLPVLQTGNAVQRHLIETVFENLMYNASHVLMYYILFNKIFVTNVLLILYKQHLLTNVNYNYTRYK